MYDVEEGVVSGDSGCSRMSRREERSGEKDG
jgi:hypothetical protein